MRPLAVKRAVAAGLLLLAACGDDANPGVTAPGANLFCEPFETVTCACPVATGTQWCQADGSAYSACSCPVQEATTRPDESVVTFELSAHDAEVDGRTLRLPADDSMAAAQVGDILVSFEGAGFLGRVAAIGSRDGSVVIETEEVTLADAFEELYVEVDLQAPLDVWMPEEIRRDAGILPNAAGKGSRFAGLDISAAGSVTPGFEIRDGSFLDLSGPNINAGFRFGKTGEIDVGLFDAPKFGLRWFKFVVDTGLDLRLNSTISVEANASGTASLELIEAALAAAGYEYAAPARYPIGGGLEATFFFFVECGVEVNGSAELDTFIEIDGDVEASLRYNFDASPKWRTPSDSRIDADAGIEDFDWQANGQVLCQIKPEIELSIFRSGGPFINAGPYFLTQGQAGPRYRIEVGGGVRGDVGGRVNILDTGTIWEETWELFDYYLEFYGQDFAVCGDGYLQIGEECDEGFLVDGEGCNSSCECGDFWRPASNRIDPSDDIGFRPGGWGEFNYEGRFNGCEPTCGDGVVDADEGEVCDDGAGNNSGGYGSCDPSCQRRYCVCGDGIVDDAGGTAFEAQSVNLSEFRVTSTTVSTGDLCAEVCDDGNTESGDGCRADCLGLEVCGDFFYDPGEECDLGEGNGGDTWCLDGCVIDRGCGDGRVAFDEPCDSGGVDSAQCNANCTPAVCGDGYVNSAAGEECDDGNDYTRCDPDCTVRECGDGYVNPNEACDTGGASATCDVDCTPVECGDGTVNPAAGEECDSPGGPANTSQCDIDCTRPVCGDGVVNPAALEVCDDGDNDDCTPECGAGCQGEGNRCGDGLRRCGEACDDNNTVSGDSCRADCLGVEVCGDGLVDPGEVCDDGNNVSGDGCRADCLGRERCGDNLVDIGEICDDGNTDPCEGECLADCSDFRADSCGDGVLTAPCDGCEVCEVCEDTVPDNSAADLGCTDETPNCTECGQCSADVCGDGFVGPTEACDGFAAFGFCFDTDGNYQTCDPSGDQSACAADSPCRAAVGTCQGLGGGETACVPVGPETCDAGVECSVLYFSGGCNAACSRIITCGDGFVDEPEECEPTCAGGSEDGQSCLGSARDACTAGGGVCNACSDDCEDALCGNGRVERPMEECDPICFGGTDDQQPCTGAPGRQACLDGGGFCSECTESCQLP